MSLDIHHLVTLDQGVLSRLDKIEYKLDLIFSKQEAITDAIDELATADAAEDTVIASAVVLLQGIPGLISAAGVDPAKLAALQTDIQNQTAHLAAAVFVGTPVTSTVAGAPVITA